MGGGDIRASKMACLLSLTKLPSGWPIECLDICHPLRWLFRAQATGCLNISLTRPFTTLV